MKKLIIIPAYNESANIEKTVASIKKDAKGFDYVIINDCSVIIPEKSVKIMDLIL